MYFGRGEGGGGLTCAAVVQMRYLGLGGVHLVRRSMSD